MSNIVFHYPSVNFVLGDNIITAHVKRFQSISITEVDYLVELVKQHIEGDFGFIDFRPAVHQVSIDPAIYEYAFRHVRGVKAFALVSDSKMTEETFENLESLFIAEHKPVDFQYAFFNELSDARRWMTGILQSAE